MWTIIDYDESLFIEMIEMTREYYGLQNDISNDYFIRHEYFENPCGDPFIKFAYDYENKKMAGQYIVIPRDIRIKGKTYKSVLSLNTLTREEYRGQKVFTKLANSVYESCKREGISFCYGAPNPNSFPGFMKKLEFSKLGDAPLLLKMLNPVRIVEDKLCIPYKHNKNIYSYNFEGENKHIIEINKSNVSLVDEFWEDINNKYHVMGKRDAQYFLWRYLQMPQRNYILYAIQNKERIDGYIVGRISEVAGMRCGMIVDFLFRSGSSLEGKQLVNYLLRIYKNMKIGLVGSIMLSHTEESKLLKKNGFFVCPQKLLPQPFPIIFRSFVDLNEKEKTIHNLDNWFFTMSDYDVI